MLVFLLEELSAKIFIEAILEKLGAKLLRSLEKDIDYQIFAFEGKQDLEKHLVKKIRHYKKPDAQFLVMRDQDGGDCEKIKANLKAKIAETTKADKTVIRIACHELETFFLGDLRVVEEGLQLSGLAKQQYKKKFRIPDNLANPKEELEKISKNKYQTRSGSRAISPLLDLAENKSSSFKILLKAIENIIKQQISIASNNITS